MLRHSWSAYREHLGIASPQKCQQAAQQASCSSEIGTTALASQSRAMTMIHMYALVAVPHRSHGEAPQTGLASTYTSGHERVALFPAEAT